MGSSFAVGAVDGREDATSIRRPYGPNSEFPPDSTRGDRPA